MERCGINEPEGLACGSLMENTVVRERKYWIDWMKVVGMFFIVWGHMFPAHLSYTIYTFSVPLFFFISGFLGGGGKLSLLKIWKTLIVPYVLVCLSYLLLNVVFLYADGDLTVCNILRSAACMAAGFQSVPHGIGSAAMWFVYTLIVIKAVSGIVRDIRLQCVLAVVCLAAACRIGSGMGWAPQNFLLAFPFYWLGTASSGPLDRLVSRLRRSIISRNSKLLFSLLAAAVAVPVLYVISRHNGFVRMYLCDYGSSVWLFLAGGVLGIMLVCVVSVMLDGFRPSWLPVLSSGSIVILAYQFVPVKAYGGLILLLRAPELKNNDFITFLVSCIIMWAFVFVIRLVSDYAPVLLGGRKICK